MENIFYERELEIPKNWVSNIILERDGKGNIFERVVEDDEEEV